MAASFNTCSDVKVSYKKTLLTCATNFVASVTLSKGQVLLTVRMATPLSLVMPKVPNMEWNLRIQQNSGTVGWITEPTAIVNINRTSDKPIVYLADLVLVNTGDNTVHPQTREELERTFGDLPPITVIFEVC